MAKVKHKRIVKPVKPVEKEKSPIEQRNEYYAGEILKKTEEILQQDKPKEVELIAVPLTLDGIASCNGCYYFKDSEEKCTDKGNHDCAGVIFVEK